MHVIFSHVTLHHVLLHLLDISTIDVVQIKEFNSNWVENVNIAPDIHNHEAEV